jgi:hypothetical protein
MRQLRRRRIFDCKDVLLADLVIDREVVETRIHLHETLSRAAKVAEQPYPIACVRSGGELLD